MMRSAFLFGIPSSLLKPRLKGLRYAMSVSVFVWWVPGRVVTLFFTGDGGGPGG